VSRLSFCSGCAGQNFPGTIVAALLKSRSRHHKETTKVPVSIRLSSDVVDVFKTTGRDWQTRVDEECWKAG
jgi:uncharacterized protein (DUF4415 family)